MSTYNLDINMYSFKDFLELFDIKGDVEIEDLKRAKKKVLMSHPDKSKLSSDYFFFYKKAYEIIYYFFEDKVKQSKSVPNEEVTYSAMNESEQMKSQMNEVMKNMKATEFHQKFNTMFEKNMATKPDESRNEWFRSEDPQYDLSSSTTKENMASRFDQIKQQNKIIKYNGVKTLNQGGTNLYDEETDDYINCDPFSKLKFDDLRKVHKDETVMAVSENDLSSVKMYNSVDHLQRSRTQDSLNPMEKTQAEKMMEMRRKEKEEMIRQKQYQSTLHSMENEKKNKSILASFLRLTN